MKIRDKINLKWERNNYNHEAIIPNGIFIIKIETNNYNWDLYFKEENGNTTYFGNYELFDTAQATAVIIGSLMALIQT